MKKDDLLAEKSKGGGNGFFDGVENDGFDKGFGANERVFDTKKHSNIKLKPEYRRVVKYFKSSKKYSKDRSRRKQVMMLLEQNLTRKQIAVKLGVSERTVNRDMAKIRPYYERRVRHYLCLMDQKQQSEFEAEYEALKPKEKLKWIRFRMKLLEIHIKQLKQRQYLRNKLSITIDLDNMKLGFPKIEVKPQLPCSFRIPCEISLAFNKNGSTTQVQKIVIGANATGAQT